MPADVTRISGKEYCSVGIRITSYRKSSTLRRNEYQFAVVTATNGIGIPTFEWWLGNQALSTTNAITVSSPGTTTFGQRIIKVVRKLLKMLLHPKPADYAKQLR
jgi:hypothetical protein